MTINWTQNKLCVLSNMKPHGFWNLMLGFAMHILPLVSSFGRKTKVLKKSRLKGTNLMVVSWQVKQQIPTWEWILNNVFHYGSMEKDAKMIKGLL